MRPEDVSASLRDGGVALTVGTSGESVLLKSYLTEVAFAEGSRWTWNEVLEKVGPTVFQGTDGDDVLKGSILDDTFMGGKGSDRLEGGKGNDIYVWNLGDGDDIVSDGLGANVLKLGAGIAPGDVGTSVREPRWSSRFPVVRASSWRVWPVEPARGRRSCSSAPSRRRTRRGSWPHFPSRNRRRRPARGRAPWRRRPRWHGP